MRLDDLGDNDVMVALLDDRGDPAFDRGNRRIEDRRPIAGVTDGLAGDLAAFNGSLYSHLKRKTADTL